MEYVFKLIKNRNLNRQCLLKGQLPFTLYILSLVMALNNKYNYSYKS